MFTKIKEFLFGKDPVQSPVAAPYKVETPAPAVTVDGHGDVHEVASSPVKTQPKAPAKPKAAPKPKTPAKPKAPAKPRTPKTPVAK